MDGPAKEVFTIRVRRQTDEFDYTDDGSGTLIDEYSETDDSEPEKNDDTVAPNRVAIESTTPIFDVLVFLNLAVDFPLFHKNLLCLIIVRAPCLLHRF